MAAKHWCFTINNPTVEDNPRVFRDCSYVVWQLEQGENGTPHIQGYLALNAKKRISFLSSLSARAHWTLCRGSPQQNKDYCTKAEGRLDGPWELGVLPLTGGQAEHARWALILADAKAGRLAELEEREPRVTLLHRSKLLAVREWATESLATIDARWFCGSTGSGKSSEARKLFPGAYIKAANNKWWCGYMGEDAVIMEDMDCTHTYMAFHLKTWADHYPFPAERKGGSLGLIRPKTIIVTSNYTIDSIFPGS